MLTTQTYGEPGNGPPLLIAHGLYGSARNWGVIAKKLSEARRVVVVDMRNHGESPWFDTHSYEDMAFDLGQVLDGPSDVLGHSMGGKAAMMLALTAPGLVNKLIVADIAPVAYAHTQMPMIDAMRRVDLSKVSTRRDADTQLARDIEDRSVRAFLLQSLDVQERRWKLNLDVLAHDMEKIIGFPDIESARFDGPTLFLSGAKSDYVTRAHRGDIKALFTKPRFAKIPDAGHWLHADNPGAFVAAALTFLDH